MKFKQSPPRHVSRFASYLIKMHDKEWNWTPKNSGLKTFDWFYIDDRFRLKRGESKAKYVWDAPSQELIKLMANKPLKKQEIAVIKAALWLKEVNYFSK